MGCFLLAIFKFSSLLLAFSSLSTVCLGVGFFVFTLFEVLLNFLDVEISAFLKQF